MFLITCGCCIKENAVSELLHFVTGVSYFFFLKLLVSSKRDRCTLLMSLLQSSCVYGIKFFFVVIAVRLHTLSVTVRCCPPLSQTLSHPDEV